MQEDRMYSFLKKCFAACVVLAFFAILFAGDYMISLCIAIMVVLLVLLPRIPQKVFPVMLVAFALLIRVVVVFAIRTQPVSDFLLQYEAAQKFAAGDYSYMDQNYFKKWGYQVGLVIYEGLLLKIHNGTAIIKLVNCLFSTGTVYLVYKICRRMVTENAARFAAVCWMLLLFQTLYVTVLSNSVPSTFFIMLAVALYIKPRPEQKSRCLIRYSLIGICMAASEFFWPGGIILILSLIATAVFAWIRERTVRRVLNEGVRLAVILVVYYAVFQLVSFGTVAAGYTEKGLTNGDPSWKLVVGTNFNTNGQYDENLFVQISDIMQTQGVDREEAESQIVKEHLSQGSTKLLQLALQKLDVFWTDPTLDWSLQGLNNVDWLKTRMTAFASAQTWLALISCLAGSMLFFRKPRNDEEYLLPFFIMATFCCYIIIEIQPRYSYTVFAPIVMMSAWAAESIGCCGQALKEKFIKK